MADLGFVAATEGPTAGTLPDELSLANLLDEGYLLPKDQLDTLDPDWSWMQMDNGWAKSSRSD